MAVTIMVGETIFYLEESGNVDSQRIELNDMNSRDSILDLLDKLLLLTSQNQEELFEHFVTLHDDQNSYTENFNYVADYLFITENSQIAQAYYDLEFQYHLKNKLHVYKCVKSHLGTSEKSFKFLSLGKVSKSIIGKMKARLTNLGPVKKLLKFLNKNSIAVISINYLMAVKQITWYFTDLIKDIFLIITITRFVPLSASSWDSFGCQIFFILLLSIILPEFAHVFTFWKKNYSLLHKIWPIVKILLAALTPILSSVTLYVSSRYKTSKDLINLRAYFISQKENEYKFQSHLKRVRERVKNLEKKENHWHGISARMRWTENIFEHTLQVIILVIFTALIFTKTQTVDGLQQLYADENIGWFILSTLMSIRSLTVGYQGWIDNQKNNTLSLTGKIILQLFAFISLVSRLSAIILFFAPSLGLLNLLMHWKMGSLPGIYNFVEGISNLPDPRKSPFYLIFQAGDNLKGELPDLSVVDNLLKDASNFDTNWIKIMYYQDLTMFTIETYYICFLVGVIIHFFLVCCIKHFLGMGFSRSTSGKFEEKLLHVASQFAIPSPFKDWDNHEVSDENISDYIENWKKVSKEMRSLLLLFSIENIILLIPIFILNHKIRIRNNYLDQKFPQIQEEQFSTDRVFFLSIVMPVVYIVIPFIQYFLFIVYNKYGHSWSKIFKAKKFGKISKKQIFGCKLVKFADK